MVSSRSEPSVVEVKNRRCFFTKSDLSTPELATGFTRNISPTGRSTPVPPRECLCPRTGSRTGLLKIFPMEYLTLKQAATRLGVTKKRIYRAVSSGHLEATEGTYRGQTALKVKIDDLEKWAQEWVDDTPELIEEYPATALGVPQEYSLGTPEVPQSHTRGTPVPPQEYPESAPDSPVSYSWSTPEAPPSHPGGTPVPPPEAYVAMLDRVARAERRAVELEFEMRKHRLLLAENAESVHEREAVLKETQAKFQELNEVVKDKEEERDLARSEATQAKAEAELLRDKLNQLTMENETLWAQKRKPWWKKMFSAGQAG